MMNQRARQYLRIHLKDLSMKMDMRSVNILLVQAIGSGKIMRLKNGYSGNEAMEGMLLSSDKCVSGLFILTRVYAKQPCTQSTC